MVSKDLLAKAAESFGFEVETLVFISNSCNEVYRFTKNDQPFILRLSEKPFEYVEKIKAEVDWVYYLAQNGVQTSLPIRTIDQQLIAVYREQEQCFIATAFHMATGRFFDKNDKHLWGSTIFSNWGETMGRMHLLTKAYAADVAVKRDDWRAWNIDNPHLEQGRYQVLLQKLKGLDSRIASLPKDGQSYGLIHNDFHPYNFHIDRDDITVFDFDDSIYGWYALDIAIAATHAVWWGSPVEDRQSKNEFAKRFLAEFLAGYLKHNSLDTYWIQQIPMFMDYRNISSYFWWLSNWDGDESRLSESQHTAISHAIHLIQQGQMFDGCDIQL